MAKMMPFNELLELIDENPITGAQEAQKRNDGVREMNYQSSVSAGALYRRLKSAPALISAFYSLPFWASDGDRKSYTKNPKHLNKHCHQFVYGAGEGPPAKRAEDHATATQESFDDESKSLSDILEALKKGGGFDGLRKAKLAQGERDVRTRRIEVESVQSSQESDAEIAGSNKTSERFMSRKAAVNHSGNPMRNPGPKISMKKVFEHLLVAMEPSELNRFLADKSDVGDSFRIVVERDADDENGILVWRAIQIGRIHEAT